ncbi:MAG: hypothetical protein VXY75_05470, partial [Bacteroidota bacterium]|nr:hypothetical protein [Bacteroidota bacterium]
MFAKIGYYGLCFLCLVPSLQASFPFELYSPSSTGATASLSEQAKNYGWMYAGLLYPHFLNINQTGGDQREAESRMFAMASSDKSYCILKNIFGLMPGLFSFEPEDVHKSDVDLGKYPSCGGGIMAGVFNHNGSSKITYPSQFTASSGLMASLVQVFNTGIIMLLFIVITYQIFMGGVLLTAIEGNIMDRNFTLYHMFRMVSGLGLVAPYFAYGYSLLQMIVMYLILLGVSFADSVFV